VVDGGKVTPITRLLHVDDYLDYIANRVLPDEQAIRQALEGLWSSSAVPGADKAAQNFAIACEACGLPGAGWEEVRGRMFMVMLQDFMDPWTFNQKNVMKCCKEILLPGGHQIPFCAYNSVGYREQAREQLAGRERGRRRAARAGAPFEAAPITFDFARRRPAPASATVPQ
jgi:uncharacterized radical SAM superfamily Fe-S cluster-containing enzyme